MMSEVWGTDAESRRRTKRRSERRRRKRDREELRRQQDWDGCRLAIRRTPFRSSATQGDRSPRTGRSAETRRSELGGDQGERTPQSVRLQGTACGRYAQPGAASQLDWSSVGRSAEENEGRIRNLQEQVADLQKMLMQLRLKEGPDLPTPFPCFSDDEDGELNYMAFSDDSGGHYYLLYNVDDESELGSDDEDGELIFLPHNGGDDSELYILPHSCFVEDSELPPPPCVNEDGEPLLPSPPCVNEDGEPLLPPPPCVTEDGQLPPSPPPCVNGGMKPPDPQDIGASLWVRGADIGPWGGCPGPPVAARSCAL